VDCFEENGGCTVFGCSHAPSDELPVRVTAGDLEPAQDAAIAHASAATQRSSIAPPPPTSSGVAPPPSATGAAAASSKTFGTPPLSLAEVYAGVQARKSRTTFVLLGVFFGAFGVHNFYAGYPRKGAAQLCLSLFTCFYAAIVSEIWAIVEVCTVTMDGDQQDFQ
jgi:TM2 domain-containing membrane protein YozV